MKDLKKLVFVAALLLSLVGGTGQASADPGTPPSASVTFQVFGATLTAGVTWEE